MGELDKYKKVAEHVTHAANSISKLLLDEMPGGGILKALWSYGSDLQVTRSLMFLTQLQDALETKLGRKFTDQDLQREDLHDLFSKVMSEVQVTNSQLKKERLRNILVNQVVSPIESQLSIKYALFLEELSDVQLIILEKIMFTKHYLFSVRDMCILLSLNEREQDITEVQLENEQIPILISGNETLVEPHDIEFYFNDLISKGLLIKSMTDYQGHDPKLNSKWINRFSFNLDSPKYSNSRTIYVPSSIAYKFIKFIKNDSTQP